MPTFRQENNKKKTWLFRTYRTNPETNISEQFTRRGFDSKAAAKEAERLFVHPILTKGKEIKNKNINTLFQDHIEEFLKEKEKTLKVSTIDGYKYSLSRAKAYFKSKKINELTFNDGVNFQNTLIKEGLSNARINKIILHTSRYCEYLRIYFNMKEDIFSHVVRLKKVVITSTIKKDNLVNLDDFKRFLDSMTADEFPFKVLLLCMMTCGTRISETLGLKWKCVNFKEHYILINSQYYRDSQGARDHTPKTQTSNRKIYLTKSFEDELFKLYKLNEKMYNLEELYVFGGAVPYNIKKIERLKRKHCKMVDMPYFKNHALRHTYTSVMIENKEVDRLFVSSQLGHSSLSITESVYTHILPDVEAKNSHKIYELE